MSIEVNLTTVRIDLDYDMKGNKVICKVWKCWETRIKSKKYLSEICVCPGTKYIDLSQRKIKNRKIDKKFVEETWIGKGLKWMCTDDKKALFVKFSTAYYLPFSDYPDLLELKKQKKQKQKNPRSTEHM